MPLFQSDKYLSLVPKQSKSTAARQQSVSFEDEIAEHQKNSFCSLTLFHIDKLLKAELF